MDFEEKKETGTDIESVLEGIEFPGEDETRITAYIEGADIPESVVIRIQAAIERKHRIKIWGIVAAFAFLLLAVLGTNQYLVSFLVVVQSALILFAAVALAAVFLAGLIGIILNLDFSRFEKIFHQHDDSDNFFHRLFHP